MTFERAAALTRVGGANGAIPLVALLVAVGVAAAGHVYVGGGIAVGAGLGLFNTIFLLKRISVAITTGNLGAAMVSMQVGLLATFTVVGALTVLMVLISAQMAVAMGISFFATQTAELVAFFFARSDRPAGMSQERAGS